MGTPQDDSPRSLRGSGGDREIQSIDVVLLGDWREVDPGRGSPRNDDLADRRQNDTDADVCDDSDTDTDRDVCLDSDTNSDVDVCNAAPPTANIEDLPAAGEMDVSRETGVQQSEQTEPTNAAETEYWPPADSTRSKSRLRALFLAAIESIRAKEAEKIPPPPRRRAPGARAVRKPFRPLRPRSPREAFLKANEALKNWSTRFVIANGVDELGYSPLRRTADPVSSGHDSGEENPDGSATDVESSSSRNDNNHSGGGGSRNFLDFAMLEMTSAYSYVLNRICEDVQQEMAGKAKEDEFEWTVNAEVLFFYALIGHKPVGVNRHFMMLLIHNKFSNFINREISSKVLWDRLDTMYDMTALHESEIIPFPTEEVDFELPEDCHDLLYSKFGVTLEKPNSDNNDVDKNSASTSKSSKKPTPKIKQSGTPASTSKSNFASPVLGKPSKSQSSVKSETKSSDATPKAKLELGSSSKAGKIKRSSSPFSNKTVKSESLSVTKEDSPDISTNKKNSKLERGSSPAVLKKPVKVESASTNSASKKPAKSESNSNGSKQIKSETPDSSAKKIKSEKDLPAKKGKTTSSSSEASTKKPKADVNSVKKKNDHESSSKKSGSDLSSVKQAKAEVKSSSHSSKGQETGTPPPSGSRKSSPVVKVKGSESGKKLKRPKLDESSKKLTPASKRRRQ